MFLEMAWFSEWREKHHRLLASHGGVFRFCIAEISWVQAVVFRVSTRDGVYIFAKCNRFAIVKGAAKFGRPHKIYEVKS